MRRGKAPCAVIGVLKRQKDGGSSHQVGGLETHVGKRESSVEGRGGKMSEREKRRSKDGDATKKVVSIR